MTSVSEKHDVKRDICSTYLIAVFLRIVEIAEHQTIIFFFLLGIPMKNFKKGG